MAANYKVNIQLDTKTLDKQLKDLGVKVDKVGKVKQGLEMLSKAYDLDPIPQGQSTSDNRLRDLILGYFIFYSQ